MKALREAMEVDEPKSKHSMELTELCLQQPRQRAVQRAEHAQVGSEVERKG